MSHADEPGDLPSPGPVQPLSRPALLQAAGLVGLALLAPAPLVGCRDSGRGADLVGDLRRLLQARWNDRYAGRPGSLSLQVLTPSCDYFASTLEGVTAGHHFRAASTTKTFTAASIMLLDQRGLLRIDDPVSAVMPGRSDTYLPNTPGYAIPHRNQITIRHLLRHRAGVFDVTNQVIPLTADVPYAGRRYPDWLTDEDPLHTFTKDELAGVLATLQLANFAPGARYSYSDSGFMLLGKIVEQVSGLPLHVFKTRELLQPSGLTQTHFITDGAEWALPFPFIEGYTLAENTIYPATEYNYSYDPGSGNLITTPADLARWIRRLLRGEAGLTPAQVARMGEAEAPDYYGLGLARRLVGALDLGLGHTGATAGCATFAFHDPKTDVTRVLQCSILDTDDMLGESQWIGSIEADALKLLGY